VSPATRTPDRRPGQSQAGRTRSVHRRLHRYGLGLRRVRGGPWARVRRRPGLVKVIASPTRASPTRGCGCIRPRSGHAYGAPPLHAPESRTTSSGRRCHATVSHHPGADARLGGRGCPAQRSGHAGEDAWSRPEPADRRSMLSYSAGGWCSRKAEHPVPVKSGRAKPERRWWSRRAARLGMLSGQLNALLVEKAWPRRSSWWRSPTACSAWASLCYSRLEHRGVPRTRRHDCSR